MRDVRALCVWSGWWERWDVMLFFCGVRGTCDLYVEWESWHKEQLYNYTSYCFIVIYRIVIALSIVLVSHCNRIPTHDCRLCAHHNWSSAQRISYPKTVLRSLSSYTRQLGLNISAKDIPPDRSRTTHHPSASQRSWSRGTRSPQPAGRTSRSWGAGTAGTG